MDDKDVYVKLARDTVETFARKGKLDETKLELPRELLKRKAGVFVSIHKKNGDLRGCIGTISPVQKNIALEIIHNAVSASSEDPRFSKISADELEQLEYGVDVLEEPETIDNEAALNPKKYGVIVTLGGRRGLLLPDLDGVNTIDEQITISMRKAGIPLSERAKLKLQRFTVTRHS